MGIEPTIWHYLAVFILPAFVYLIGNNEALRIFLAGYLFHMGTNMAVQDWMGMEEWLTYAVPRWINFNPAVGIVVCVLAVAIYYVARRRVRDNMFSMFNEANKIAGLSERWGKNREK